VKARAVVALLALAAAIGIAAPASAQAQTGTITGLVTDRAAGSPMQGVAVQVVGTRLAATTNEQGRYMILNVPAGTQRVTAQYLGFGDLTVPVTVVAGQTATVNMAMEQTVLSLQEVVVTGVSEATTGARAPFTIGRVSRENIATVPTTASAVGAIQGKIAGANVVRGSGQPGSGVSILLRTPTSIQGSSTPMFVIDGVIMASSIGGTTVDLESLDIESIEVVKGAAAASLYGSRAASGVIAITTNRGRNLQMDQTRITARTELGTSSAPTPTILSSQHYYLQDEQGRWVDRDGNQVARSNRVVVPTNMMDQPYRTPTYDNASAFFRPARFAQNSVNLSHRAQSTNFMVSATRFHETGTLETNEGFTRNNFRVNLDHRLRSDFSLAVSAQHSRYDRDLLYGGTDGTYWDLLMFPIDMNLGVRGPDGQFLQQPDTLENRQNPLWYEASREYNQQRTRSIASVDARFNPFQFFTVAGNLGYDRSDARVHAYTPRGTSTSITSEIESQGFLQKDDDVGDVLSASLQSNFTWNFGELSTRTLARALLEREQNEFIRATGSNFHVPGVPRLNVAADRTVSSSFTDVRSTGYMAEQTLDYANRYLLTALVRRDGSSLFGSNERWQNYWRVGGSWDISQEAFWGIQAFTLFKPRYSIGTAGGRPGFSAQYETWNVSSTGAVTRSTLGNRNLRPEHTTEQEMGLDMIINDRYSIQLTRARQKTRDQIIQMALPAMLGYPTQWVNTGVQSGNTWEATVEAQVVNRPGFTYSTTFVADRSRSTIDEWNRSCFISGLRNVCGGASLADMWGERFLRTVNDISTKHPGAASQFQVNDEGYVVWVGEGASWRDGLSRNLWGTRGTVDGVLYDWGLPILDRDENGFTIIQQIGSSDPSASLGWLNNVFYRGFALHTQMHAQIGGNTYNNTRQRLYQHERHVDLQQGDKALETRKTLNYYQRLYNANNNTSHFVEEGSFVKLRAVSLQYRLNQDQLNRFGVGRLARGLNIGVNARNIFTLTNYSGFDPEVGSVLSRYDSFSYPNTRNLTFTAEVTF
jgi:TonB-linked SusC/RagA family outer membrane protein